MSVNNPLGRMLAYPADDQQMWDELSARPIVGIPFNIAHVTKLVVEGPCILVAIFAHETGAAAGALDVYDGRDTTGQLVASQNVASGGSVAIGPHQPGLLCRRGITLDVTTSTIKGGVWVQV